MTPLRLGCTTSSRLLMLAVAAYGLAAAGRLRAPSVRSPVWDVDIAHIFMGVSMAGMFVADGPSGPAPSGSSSSPPCWSGSWCRACNRSSRSGIHLPH